MSHDIRVVRVLTRFNVGGPARQALALQTEMPPLGVATTLAVGAVESDEVELPGVTGTPGIVRVPGLRRSPDPVDDLTALRALTRLFRRVRPHVVHTHMAKAGVLGRMAAIAAGVPVRVHTFEGHILHDYFGRVATAGWVAAERVLAPTTTALIAVSRQVRQDLLDHGVGRPDRFLVVDVGADLDRLLQVRRNGSLRSALGIGQSDRVVAMAGRLVSVKGVDVFLEAMLPLLASLEDVQLVVAGDGPEGRRLEEAATRRPGGDRIHRLGWVSDMSALYAAADVIVMSSRNEGTPLTLIEAAAAGLPVVATRVGGIPEVVEDGVTGLLVPSEAPTQLEEAVRRLLNDPTMASRMGAAGRRAAARFTAGRLAERLACLYRDLLGTPR